MTSEIIEGHLFCIKSNLFKIEFGLILDTAEICLSI